ncbi:MAG: lamin tail domain-containing protein [Acetobacterium sp.]
MTKIKDLFKHISRKEALVFAVILISLFVFAGCSVPTAQNELDFEGYKLIEVDGGSQSGDREPNVVVDIGFGDREYYAFTNEHGQLIKVTAEKIILQDPANEPVLATGRYYSDEAKVSGVESPTLDEGHVIADSLGGVSNAYNITPQDSVLNRHGDQAYMEKVIRDAGGCTNFTALITYPTTSSQIPSHYSYTYTLKGNVIHDEFDNVNPDEVNKALGLTTPTEKIVPSTGVVISELDKKAEYIVIKNSSANAVDLTGWKIVSVLGNQSFTFPAFSLASGASVKIGDSAKNSDIDFHWLDGSGTWNNSKSDPAELYDSNNELVDEYND